MSSSAESLFDRIGSFVIDDDGVVPLAQELILAWVRSHSAKEYFAIQAGLMRNSLLQRVWMTKMKCC